MKALNVGERGFFCTTNILFKKDIVFYLLANLEQLPNITTIEFVY